MRKRKFRTWYPEPYLAHHGILGQKWGKKNGPPYPLGESDHSASEKKAGYEQSIQKGQLKDFDTFCKEDLKTDYKDVDDPELQELMCMDYIENSLGYKYFDNGYGPAYMKQVSYKSPRGSDSKYDIEVEAEYVNPRTLNTLYSVEKNIQEVDRKARQSIVNSFLTEDHKPWKYEKGNDAYPEEGNMNLEDQKKDMYEHLGTFDLGADSPEGKRYLKRASHIGIHGDEYGMISYADGGSYFDHELSIEFYAPNSDAKKMKFSNASMDG